MIGALLDYALRSAALILLVLLALKVLAVRNPSLERSAWLAVLVASLAMPLLVKLSTLSPVGPPEIRWPSQWVQLVYPVADPAFDWQVLASLAVMVVSSVMFVRQCLGLARWRRICLGARQITSPQWADCEVRATSRVRSPATAFSTILVPDDFETWTPQQQRAVIAHECAHVANRDFYVQCLAHVHRAIFWFNPLAWWLADRLSVLSEYISDDAALEQQAQPQAYAELLLGFARRATAGEQIVSIAGKSSLAARLDRVLSVRKHVGVDRRKALLLIFGLTPLVGAVAAFNADARIVRPKSDPAMPLTQPSYPAGSRRLGQQGTVIMRLHVLADGSVADARIIRSSGHPDLDYSAIHEAKRWRVAPGTVNESPTHMWARFAVTFKLATD